MSRYRTTVCNGCQARVDGWPNPENPDVVFNDWGRITMNTKTPLTGTRDIEEYDLCPSCIKIALQAVKNAEREKRL